MNREVLVDFLRSVGADETSHSSSTLLDHLVGTSEIVERWGGNTDVQAAALFHSVYGTEYFHAAPMTSDADERRVIVDLIGERAERLAWLFCVMRRMSLYAAAERGAPYMIQFRLASSLGTVDGMVEVTAQELRDLFLIVWANAVEQAPRSKPGTMVSRKGLERARPFLPEQALQDAMRFL